jgi:hypothetical protein
MRYFKNFDNEVYGFDADQNDLAEEALNSGMLEITGQWPPVIERTKEDRISELSVTINQKMHTVSTEWGYDSIVSATSYINSTNPQFAADASALITWRDQIWEWAFTVFSTIEYNSNLDLVLENMPVAPEKPTT